MVIFQIVMLVLGAYINGSILFVWIGHQPEFVFEGRMGISSLNDEIGSMGLGFRFPSQLGYVVNNQS